jgi:hypothetical protein
MQQFLVLSHRLIIEATDTGVDRNGPFATAAPPGATAPYRRRFDGEDRGAPRHGVAPDPNALRQGLASRERNKLL